MGSYYNFLFIVIKMLLACEFLNFCSICFISCNFDSSVIFSCSFLLKFRTLKNDGQIVTVEIPQNLFVNDLRSVFSIRK